MGNRCGNVALCLICMFTFTHIGYAQKVRIGYDKSVKFSQYKTYTLTEPSMPPTWPLLYSSVVNSIDGELSSKGLRKVDKDGDLTVIPAGGIEYGNNVAAGSPIIGTFSGSPPAMNATMWTGAGGPSALSGPIVPEGTLVLEFVDRTENKVVWNGSVYQKLDLEQKQKSLELASKAVFKLLKQFPPKSSRPK